ncbi:hypothetical protein [Pectinatus frisingensis]|uniref:hypothetical protein n=1 Tax=Pectinatus frisingensis TaxID=865 RepID=UPI0015F49B7B|nr:hypothetical protein [Pectinatus frisingensis]
MNIKQLNRTALLLALIIVFQSLRLFLPIPFFVSVYIIGSLVNACFLLAAATIGCRFALILAVIAPIVAYMQKALPLPILILPIAAANLSYIAGYLMFFAKSRILAISMASIAKFVIIYLTVIGIIQYLGVTGKTSVMLTMMLGWPQLITGFTGGGIFLAVCKKLSI